MQTSRPKIISYSTSEDQDIECTTCGRMVKRAVEIDGHHGQHGLDCAAKLLGMPRGRTSIDTIEIEGVTAEHRRIGAEIGQNLRNEVGQLPTRAQIGWDARYTLICRHLGHIVILTQRESAIEAWAA